MRDGDGHGVNRDGMGTAGYDIHTRTWPLDRVHGVHSLADAARTSIASTPSSHSMARGSTYRCSRPGFSSAASALALKSLTTLT